MGTEQEEIAEMLGAVVVLDTVTPFIYIGTLKAWQDHVIVLEHVDVHDVSDGRSGKEVYALEARRTGVQQNRVRVMVRKDQVVGVSRLSDVIQY